MELEEVFPELSLRSKFEKEVRIYRRGRGELKEISELKGSCLAEIGGGAWDRYVQANPDCDSQALAEYFQRNDPKIYLAMERKTGLKVLHAISYTVAEVVDEELENNCSSELLLAVAYPGVLRISDVTFCNPYKSATKRYQVLQSSIYYYYFVRLGIHRWCHIAGIKPYILHNYPIELF